MSFLHTTKNRESHKVISRSKTATFSLLNNNTKNNTNKQKEKEKDNDNNNGSIDNVEFHRAENIKRRTTESLYDINNKQAELEVVCVYKWLCSARVRMN